MTTGQLKELRIGNIIIDEYGHIHEMSIDLYKNIEVNGWGEFVPLTEEWLLKFGFEKQAEIKFIKAINQHKNFSIIFHKNSKKYTFPYFHGVETLTSFQYVHELQNLYRALIKQELTIK